MSVLGKIKYELEPLDEENKIHQWNLMVDLSIPTRSEQNDVQISESILLSRIEERWIRAIKIKKANITHVSRRDLYWNYCTMTNLGALEHLPIWLFQEMIE